MSEKHIKHSGEFKAEKFPYKSLRGFLGDMESRNELAHIKDQIDTRFEVGAIAKKVANSLHKSPGIYYHNLKDFPDWTLVTNVLSNWNRIFRIIGSTRERVFEDFAQRTEDISISKQDDYYTIVKGGDFEELNFEGDNVDITKIPAPLWSEFDGGRYLTTGLVMSQNFETGKQNMSIVRLMIQGPNQTGILITSRQDIGKNYLSHKIKDKNMPIAVTIGVDPLMHLSSQINAPRDFSEFAYAGALGGEKVQMTRCKNSDLLVPKSAEIVMEGEIALDEFQSEGPFGEFHGFYSGRRDLNVFKINRLAMKEDAIYPGMGVGKDPNEGNLLTAFGSNLSFMKYARTHFSEICGIRSISGIGFTTVVAVDHKKAYPGIGKAAGHFVWSSPQVAKEAKNIIVVDDTIDIYSDIDIFWAIGNYVQGNKDISVVEGTPGTILDPSEPWGMGYIEEDKTLQTTNVTIIDATPKYGRYSEGYKRGVVDFPEEVKKRIEEKWSEWGLDKFV